MANLLWFPLHISSPDHLGSRWAMYPSFWHLVLKEIALGVPIVFWNFLLWLFSSIGKCTPQYSPMNVTPVSTKLKLNQPWDPPMGNAAYELVGYCLQPIIHPNRRAAAPPAGQRASPGSLSWVSRVRNTEKQGEKWASELKVWLSPHVYLLGTTGITIWIGLKESLVSTVDTEWILLPQCLTENLVLKMGPNTKPPGLILKALLSQNSN